jgi:hypothetical protein
MLNCWCITWPVGFKRLMGVKGYVSTYIATLGSPFLLIFVIFSSTEYCFWYFENFTGHETGGVEANSICHFQNPRALTPCVVLRLFPISSFRIFPYFIWILTSRGLINIFCRHNTTMHFVYVVLHMKCVKFEITPQEITLRFVEYGQNTPHNKSVVFGVIVHWLMEELYKSWFKIIC